VVGITIKVMLESKRGRNEEKRSEEKGRVYILITTVVIA